MIRFRRWLIMGDDVRTETNIAKSKRDIYTQLTEDEDSLFYKSKDTDLFVAAAAVGFYYQKSEPIVGAKHSLYPMSMFKSDDPNLWIIKSIAVAASGIDVLKNLRDVAAVVEAYANAGIDILYQRHIDSEDEVSSMAADLLQIIEQDSISG